MAWKKTKKGKFSLKKEPPKSWRDRQLNERQNRVEMLRLHDEMVRRLHLATLALFTGAFADPPVLFLAATAGALRLGRRAKPEQQPLQHAGWAQ